MTPVRAKSAWRPSKRATFVRVRKPTSSTSYREGRAARNAARKAGICPIVPTPASLAFSLVELLVVLALLLILTVMSTSRFSSSARHKELVGCQRNLQKIYLALSIYRSDNGAYPFVQGAITPAAPLSLLVPKSTTVTEIFICPGSHDKPLAEGERFAGSRISYAYYMGWPTNAAPQEIVITDWQIDNAPKKMGQPIFSIDGKKPGNNHYGDGGNLLSLGGEVSSCGRKASRDLLFPATVTLLNP
jgi:type II secretory pathway pseudopilin PulG